MIAISTVAAGSLPGTLPAELEDVPASPGAEGFAAAMAAAKQQCVLPRAALPLDALAVPATPAAAVASGGLRESLDEPAFEEGPCAGLLAAASLWPPAAGAGSAPPPAGPALTAHEVADCVRQLWAPASEREPMWQLLLQDAHAPALQLKAVPGAHGWALTLSGAPALASLTAERLRERLLLKGQRIETVRVEHDGEPAAEGP